MITVTHLQNQEFKINIRGHELMSAKSKENQDYPPTPPELFVSSLAACIGVYAVSFLGRHNIKTEGLTIEAEYTSKKENNQSWIDAIKIKLGLPETLDEKYESALMKVVDSCMVHETIRRNPKITIEINL